MFTPPPTYQSCAHCVCAIFAWVHCFTSFSVSILFLVVFVQVLSLFFDFLRTHNNRETRYIPVAVLPSRDAQLSARSMKTYDILL